MQLGRRGRIGAAVIASALTVAAAAWAADELVRSRVRAFAARRHLDVDVGAVRLGWFGARLLDVNLRPTGEPFAAVHAADVHADLTWSLAVEDVEAHEVGVHVRGTPEEVADAIGRWHSRTETPAASGTSTPLSITGIHLEWTERDGEPPIAELVDARVRRSTKGWEIAAQQLEARRGGARLTGHDVVVGVSNGIVRSARAARGAIAWESSTSAPPVSAEAAPSESALPQPPKLVARRTPAATNTTPHGALSLPLPDLRTLHGRLIALGAIARDHLDPAGALEVDSLSFEIAQGERHFKVGQGPFSVGRDHDALTVDFRTRPNATGTPLEIQASLPLEAGEATASLAGGPISLALLGVDEGAIGMTGVDATTVRGRASLSLSSAGDSLRFDGNVGVHGLALNDPKLAPDVVRGIDAALVARGALDDHGSLLLDDAELSVGAMHVVGHGTLQQDSVHSAASLALEVPVSSCQSLLQSIPSALVPSLTDGGITGTFGLRARVAFDSANLDAAVLDWTTDDRCTMSVVPEELARERFSQPFDHVVYLPDGSLETQTTGPTTENWSDLSHISPFMQVAVLTTEDGAFYRHHGFNHAAIRNALVADLKAGRFVRGASTITMQLAKNLFLTREKNLSRKLEEVILADYLESAFTKQELMELYLNVIEFGPNVYGITQAARHYFGRTPAELNLAECLFLSSILPNPVKFHRLAEKPTLSEAWTKHVRELMQVAAKIGTISPRELDEGLHEEVAFHGENDPLPAPRPAVTGTLLQSTLAPGGDEWEVTP